MIMDRVGSNVDRPPLRSKREPKKRGEGAQQRKSVSLNNDGGTVLSRVSLVQWF